jgi:processive 1,2-diacylglycerol beta-glucosyltransferase
MYITKVSGHRQATVALQQALRRLSPNILTPAVNGFGYTYPILEQVVNKAYMSVIKRTPKIWDYMYDNPKVVKRSEAIKKFLHKTSHAKLEKLFNRHKPDTIVCTQAFPCGMMADFKKTRNLNVKIIGVLTDFAPHSFWINDGVDYYIVPSQETKERFIKKGVPSDAIKVYGIPIRAKFSEVLHKQSVAAKFGIDLKYPTVLVMGGGQGLGPMKGIVKSLGKISMNLQIVVLTGKNKKTYDKIKKEAKKNQKKVIILPYVTNVEELMEISSLVITKPGGITTAESMAMGLPMVIVDPIPGQEMRNTDFLIRQGVGIRIDDTSDVGEEVELLLRSPERLAAMSKAARDNAKPRAAFDIAKLILGKNQEAISAIEEPVIIQETVSTLEKYV